MTAKPPPADIVIGRLPIYLRALDGLAKEGKDVTSSYELGKRLGISSAQIRKDLSQLGDFGKQGTGYQIDFLMQKLREILQLDRKWEMVIVGAGHMGQALAKYTGFAENGFILRAIFDSDPSKIGDKIGTFTVQDATLVQQIVAEYQIKIGMIAVPAEAAQSIADQLIEAGVQSILNYAPITLNVPEHVQVQYIDPISKMQHMSYYITTE